MPRFFISSIDIVDQKVVLTGEDYTHIAYSLRMAVGDDITLCDENATEYLSKILAITKENATIEILSSQASKSELPVRVSLFQGYPKGDKFEFIIQKAVELGVSSVTPFDSQFCIKKVKNEKTNSLLDRWNKIAAEAAKQSGRGVIPEIHSILSYDEMLKQCQNYDLTLFCYEKEETKTFQEILQNNKNIKNVAIVIGSEGGFSEKEVEKALQSHVECVTFGKRILRCETASLYALSCISYEFEA